MEPLVTALMVTGKSPERLAMAKAAVESFRLQDYPNKELLIVSDGKEPFITDDMALTEDDHIVEHRVNLGHKLSLGQLRNYATENANGQYMIQWDDDDWYHEQRISTQLYDRLRYDAVTLLQWQIRYSFVNDTAYCHSWTGKIPGIPGTMLYPKGLYRFRNEARHEDSHFLLDNFMQQLSIIDNNPNKNPGPELYIRFYHGHNTWDHRHVMGDLADPKYRGTWQLNDHQRAYLTSVLEKYYGRKPASGTDTGAAAGTEEASNPESGVRG